MTNSMRKSRVQTQVETKSYRAAAYIRLSVVKPNEQNDSIENQKNIIKDFIARRQDIQIVDFYIDENTSGASFDRKAFEVMMDDVSNGMIDCIVVKDAYVKHRLKNFEQPFNHLACHIASYPVMIS